MPISLPSAAKIEFKTKVIDEVTALRMKMDSLRQGKPKIHLTKTLTVSGPKGQLNIDLPNFVDVSQHDNTLSVTVADPKMKHQRSMWGTSRTLINNGIVGVTEGHLCIVRFVGTGFRAVLEKNPDGSDYLSLRVGYCVPRIVPVPRDILVKVPVPHRITIEGCDKQRIKLLAAEIRKHRKPEPYKGKGIFIDDETIKLKQKKIK